MLKGKRTDQTSVITSRRPRRALAHNVQFACTENCNIEVKPAKIAFPQPDSFINDRQLFAAHQAAIPEFSAASSNDTNVALPLRFTYAPSERARFIGQPCMRAARHPVTACSIDNCRRRGGLGFLIKLVERHQPLVFERHSLPEVLRLSNLVDFQPHILLLPSINVIWKRQPAGVVPPAALVSLFHTATIRSTVNRFCFTAIALLQSDLQATA